jgi:hypothetical protein
MRRHAAAQGLTNLSQAPRFLFDQSLFHARGQIRLSLIPTNLPKAGVVNVSQILTVDKAQLLEPAGKLSAAAVRAVRDGLHMLFDKLE